SALATERTLRRLMDENRRLRRELRELRKLERGLHQDPLTGLPNRGSFERRLREELSRASRARGDESDWNDGGDARTIGSILVVRLCGYDAPGASVGDESDEMIREMARVLRGGPRSADVCCRTSDDELMLLLPETDAAGARAVVQRLRGAVFRVGARRDRAMAISAGTATWPKDGGTVVELLEVAEHARRAEQRRLRGRLRRAPVRGGSGRALALVKR
ncbi:MAG TPA: GGDEF domain-containing protein, partial [Polyangia bacterium]